MVHVPFALKPAIEELQCLEFAGAIKRLPTSNWAAQIVPLPKMDCQIHIYGDYKGKINLVLDVEQYPLPKPQELFSTLAGGQRFTKLDLQQAYCQLKLTKSLSPSTLTEYTWLPFSVALAPALFSKTMETILLDIS